MNEVLVGRMPAERLSTAVGSIRPSGIRSFFDLIQRSADILSLGIGEPDLLTHEEIRKVAAEMISAGAVKYAPNAGLVSLRQSVADYMERRTGVSYEAEGEVVITAGAAQAVDLALRTTVNPGDEVVIPEPCFVSYAPCVILAGGRPVPVPLSAKTGFRLTPEALEPYLTPRSRVLMLSYPNNPTGAVLSADDLGMLAQVVVERDLTVVSDEIYSELTYGQTHASLAGIEGLRDQVIVLNGFSKAFAMTGWRLGWAVGPAALVEGMVKIQQHVLMCAPTAAQNAGVRALALVDEVAAAAREVYDRRRRLLTGGLSDLGLPCVEPRGGFFAFPSILGTGLTDEEFSQLLLRREKVAVIPGSAFGDAGSGHIRISYAVSDEKIEIALERMSSLMNDLRSS